MMKGSRFLAGLLSLCFCLGLGTASTAANTAPQTDEVAIATLMGLGVVSGYPDGGFHTEESLTRGQFCKMAVLLGGYESEAAAGSYQTMFDDVSPAHWAAGYIRVACQKGLVSGYGNGKFGPEDTVTLAQSAKVLLGLLGYEQSDIGPFYPQDHLAKAESVGLLNGLTNSEHTLTRGEAATMLYNLLTCKTKAGQEFYKSLAKSTLEDVVLLDRVDVTVTDGKNVNEYRSATQLLSTLEGQMGILLLDEKSRTVGFIPTEQDSVTLTLSTAASDRLVSLDGEIFLVEDEVPLVMEDEVSSFENGWFSLKSGDALTAYRQEGEVELVVVRSVAKGSSSQLSGRLDSAAPSLASADKLTLSGCTLSLNNEGKAALKGFSIGDLVTVTLDRSGQVEDVTAGASTMVGYATIQGEKATVALPGGTISGSLASATQAVKNLSGSLVNVRVNSDGELSLTSLSNKTYTQSLDLEQRTLGTAKLAGNLAIYERVGTAPAVKIDLSDLLLSTIPGEKIEYVGYNSAGEVELLLLQDVTGDRYDYGILTRSTQTSGMGQMTVSNTVVTVENQNGSSNSYIIGQSFENGGFGGIAGNTLTGKVAAVADMVKVTDLTRADFSGSEKVKNLPISQNLQIYNAATEQWVSLNQAKAYSNSFTAYLDRPADQGGQVRILVAE